MGQETNDRAAIPIRENSWNNPAAPANDKKIIPEITTKANDMPIITILKINRGKMRATRVSQDWVNNLLIGGSEEIFFVISLFYWFSTLNSLAFLVMEEEACCFLSGNKDAILSHFFFIFCISASPGENCSLV